MGVFSAYGTHTDDRVTCKGTSTLFNGSACGPFVGVSDFGVAVSPSMFGR